MPGRSAAAAPATEATSRRDETRSAALAELSGRLAERITDEGAVLDLVVELVSSFLGDTAVIRLLNDEGTRLEVTAVHDQSRKLREGVRSALSLIANDVAGTGTYVGVVQSGQQMAITGGAFTELLDAMPEKARDRLSGLGLTSVLICPLRAGGRVLGTLGLWRRTATLHTLRDTTFAQELADRAALAIQNARLVRQLRVEIEERTQREESLRLANELLQQADEKRRALVNHLVTAQEEERHRIAIDVHDDAIQAMAAVGVRLQVLRRRAGGTEIGEQVAKLEETVTETIARLRALLFRLEASAVETVGLTRSITRYMAEVFHETPTVTKVVSSTTQELDAPSQIVLYRIAQEAVTNAFKHASPAHLTVSLKDVDGGVELAVADDGMGFDLAEVTAHALPGHLGMRSMDERASIAGGQVRIESHPGKGTTVRCWLPSGDVTALVAAPSAG